MSMSVFLSIMSNSCKHLSLDFLRSSARRLDSSLRRIFSSCIVDSLIRSSSSMNGLLYRNSQSLWLNKK